LSPDGTIRLGKNSASPPQDAPSAPTQPTVQLRMPAAGHEETVVVAAAVPAPAQGPEQASASELDAVGEAAPAAGPESLIRFGPGVPDPKTARTIAVWQGKAAPAAAPAPERASARKGNRGWWVLALLLVLAVVGWLLWSRLGPKLAVEGVAVTASPSQLACDSAEFLVGTVRTNGHAGTLQFRWLRSDGTDSGPLTQDVRAGQRSVQLPLRWTVQGKGSFHGTATLKVTAPGTAEGAASFDYSCK
jgi:hypothetical protein